MTMIDDVAARAGLREGISTWVEVDTGFWVGNADGEFLGTIERHEPGRFSARDAVRQNLGEYRTLALAREAIIGKTG